ncbi:MAG: 30S ribosome-binding factor RbfA [Sedimentisphaerales bacterium]|jgi:ribosome-binding factor A
MKTRRQEKVARVVKEAVSDCLASHLSDPRIEGLVSVTKVEVAADLRNAEVFISVLGTDMASQNKTFNAITHASKRIQSFLAHRMQSKFCPVLHFKYDENFKKTLETMRMIDQAMGDIDKKSSNDIDDTDAIAEEESYHKS